MTDKWVPNFSRIKIQPGVKLFSRGLRNVGMGGNIGVWVETKQGYRESLRIGIGARVSLLSSKLQGFVL